MHDNPLISVVMGTYNCSEYLGEAIESILNQTIKDFEFIIIDDASSDSTYEIIQSYAQKDNRVIGLRNAVNSGLGYSLYTGVSKARGRFIARMDADDISLPQRFAVQVKFLESHPEVACVGTSAKVFGNVSFLAKLKGIHCPTQHEEIKAWLLLGTPMMHPSVMFNGELMRNLCLNYNPAYRKAQDFELWTRLVFQAPMANIDKVLHCYRYSSTMASVSGRKEQIKRSQVMYSRMLASVLGRTPVEDELELHTLFATKTNQTESEVIKSIEWSNFLVDENCKNTPINTFYLKQILGKRLVAIISHSIPSRINRVRLVNQSKVLSLFNLYTAFRVIL